MNDMLKEKARVSSDDFKKCQEITITEIDMNEEQCVLRANTGAQENNIMKGKYKSCDIEVERGD